MSQYAQVSDIEARYPASVLQDLTDPNNQAIQTAPITQALMDASAEIDSYLEARFQLPLTDPPQILVQLCCHMAMYHLQAALPALHDIGDARKRYEDAISFLIKVNKGELTLGISSDLNAEPPDPNPLVLVQAGGEPQDPCVPQRVFSRSTLKDF
ncbi:MAG TPA: phage protein Gp36 family protein [Candidatus Binataceae bacterium]|jgi:phage gp36-like protein|nr:phage protein Gp36 family protein [Candidatus Binataceae bacterium]